MQSVKTVAFSCPHFPFVDEAAWAKLCDLVRQERPDYVVCLGDVVESGVASRWPDAKELAVPLSLEFKNAGEHLEQLRGAAKVGCRLIALEGNHDANLAEPGRIDKNLRDLCDWRKGIKEIAEHWGTPTNYVYCRRRGAFRIGQQVVLAHGYETSPQPIRREAFYFADEWGLYVAGHTHRPTPNVEEVVWADLGLRKWHANVGTLRELDPHYMTRKRKWNWGHAAAVIECLPLKSPRASREWSCHIEVFGMYDERMAA